MIYLEEIAGMVIAGGFGTSGALTDGVFVYHMPENVESGVLLIDPVAGVTKPANLPDYRSCTFSILCRGADRRVLIDKMHAISELITTEANVTTGKIKFSFIRALIDPLPLPISDGGFIEVGCNYLTRFVITDYNY